jgi:PAS domain S-box-containing protein
MSNQRQFIDLAKAKIKGFSTSNYMTSPNVWMKVNQVMIQDVATISSYESVAVAAMIMHQKNISCIVALDNGKVIGILTETDLLEKTVAKEKDTRRIKVAEIMSSPVKTMSSESSVLDASEFMQAQHIKRLPLMENEKLVGIVTQTDLTRVITSYGMWRDVTEIMSRDVSTIQKNASVAKAAEVMAMRNISSIIVMDGEHFTGVLTERDLLKRVVALNKNPHNTKVEEIMTSPVISIPSNYSIFSASRTMENINIRRLVVIEHGKMCGIVTQTDIFKAVKEKIQKEEETILNFMNESKIGFYMTDLNHITTYVNPALINLLEIPDPKELINKEFLHERFWVTPEERAQVLKEFDKEFFNRKELSLKTYTGRRKYVTILSGFTIGIQGQINGYQGIVYDITEKKELMSLKQAEEAIKKSEKKWRLLAENVPDIILSVDQEGIIQFLNRSDSVFKLENAVGTTFYEYFFPDQHQLIKESIKKVFQNANSISFEVNTFDQLGLVTTWETRAVPVIHDEQVVSVNLILTDITDSKKTIEKISNLAKFPSEDPNPVLRISKNCRILYANGASSPALETWELDVRQFPPEPWFGRIKEAYDSGQKSTFELNCDDGHIFLITLQPINDSGYVNAYGLDITNHKKVEKDKMELELQLRQKQKMEAIGTLAGGIAHDFNNILGAIQGYAELSLDDLSEDSPVREKIEQILSCSDRAAKLVKQILTFSRKDELEREKEPLQIVPIIKEVLDMLRSSLPTTIKIDQKIQTESSIVLADPTQIHQILVNLCTNASHAMHEKGGILEVSLTDINLEHQTRIGEELLEQGFYVKLSVSDTGCGMKKEVLERIFEPFFTTKNVNEGTGLGLSVVHGIVKGHGGAIMVSSTPGKGTIFEIYLPIFESGVIQRSQSPESTCRREEVILLVDDEEIIVDVTRQILERFGYTVVARTNSIDALEAFQKKPDEFDLVITDQIMPNMTGTQLAEKLIAIRPDIPIILSSGFSEYVNPEEIKRIGIKEFIAKPIGRWEIVTIVQTLLEKKEMLV